LSKKGIKKIARVHKKLERNLRYSKAEKKLKLKFYDTSSCYQNQEYFLRKTRRKRTKKCFKKSLRKIDFAEDNEYCEDFINSHKKDHVRMLGKKKLRKVVIFDEFDDTDDLFSSSSYNLQNSSSSDLDSRSFTDIPVVGPKAMEFNYL
jgi:serine protease inhibitor